MTPIEAFTLATTTDIPVELSKDGITWKLLDTDLLSILGAATFCADSVYSFRVKPEYMHVYGCTSKLPYREETTLRYLYILDGDCQAGYRKICVQHPQVVPSLPFGYFTLEEDIKKFVQVISAISQKGIYLP